MNTLIDRYSPPGYNTRWEKNFTYTAIALSAFLSLGIIARLISDIGNLFYIDGGKRYLKANATCTPFADLVGGLMFGFTVTAVTCLFFIMIRRIYLNQNSKSIYTVKRLPRRFPVIKMILPLPVLYFTAVILIKYITLTVYLIIYLVAVPEEAIPSNWLEGIWRL